MKYSISIYCSPQATAQTAFEFTKEVLNQGHRIYRLFFFNDGVFNCADNTEDSLCQQWQQLIHAHGIDAITCMTSAEKRGLTLDKEIPNKTTIHPTFTPGGIAQLIDATVHSDRILSFGGE